MINGFPARLGGRSGEREAEDPRERTKQAGAIPRLGAQPRKAAEKRPSPFEGV